MLCLGIETSCDETSIAVVKGGSRILSNVVASSAELHSKYGGVIPEIASRMHLEAILPVFKSAIDRSGVSAGDIELICAVNRPGLIPALLVGFSFAKALSVYLERPLVAVDHIIAHLYAPFLSEKETPVMPFIGLIVSGGHTNLYLVKDWGDITLLGKTKDDAAGEALDKAAKLLGMGYPGGPIIDKLSIGIEPNDTFPAYMPKDNFDFSYSGLKTSLYYFLKKKEFVPENEKKQICADYQYAVVKPLIERAFKAAEAYNTKAIVFGGGVSANTLMRSIAEKRAEGIGGVKVFFPPLNLCMDNAAMVAGLGWHWNKIYGPASLSEDVHTNFLARAA